jgi:hypothetical protein
MNSTKLAAIVANLVEFNKINLERKDIVMAFKAAFIFIAPENDYQVHQAIVPAPFVELHVVGVKTYDEGAAVAKKLVDQGVGAIELCGGFGVEGVAQIKQAVQGKAVVGVVRFDIHPGLENKSGDDLFK